MNALKLLSRILTHCLKALSDGFETILGRYEQVKEINPVLWTTGGRFVLEDEFNDFLKKGNMPNL